MAGVTHDDGFHEIQLNGKQLVFLFMAVTVVSVVIFLCGVLVGRGVRLDRGAASPDAVEAMAEDLPAAPPPSETTGTSSQPMAAPDEKLTFGKQLESAALPAEKLSSADAPRAKAEPVPDPAPPAAPAAGSRAAATTPAPTSPAPPAAATPSSAKSVDTVPSAPPEPTGPGVAVQVSAFRVRQEADALANRLVGKGYSAYVVPPAPGAPALFRVRVGKFKEQAEANRVAARLKKEEQFEPWIVR
jgi:cell division septation protein DedD